MVTTTSFLLAVGLTSLVSVQFDVQPLAPAVERVAENVIQQMPESRFVQIRLDVSTIVPPEFEGALDESIIKLVTRKPSVQVADYWPRTEMYTPITTPLAVAEGYDRVRQASIQAAGGYPGIGSANGQAFFRDELRQGVQFNQQPPMQLLTAAGTIDRRAGVYFKLRSTPQSVLEGARTVIITLEVPRAWRGDVLEFHATAYGRKKADSNHERKQLGEERFLIAVYIDGDREAAEYAMTFVQEQAKLRLMADQYAMTIKKRAYPTPVHKLGSVFDIYEPSIPNDYLERWIFGSPTNQPNATLPVNLRVAMLDFIDSRIVMEALASSPEPTSNLSLAKRVTNSY